MTHREGKMGQSDSIFSYACAYKNEVFVGIHIFTFSNVHIICKSR